MTDVRTKSRGMPVIIQSKPSKITLKNLINMYDIAIEKQQDYMGRIFKGTVSYASITAEKLYALAKYELKVLESQKAALLEEIEKCSDDNDKNTDAKDDKVPESCKDKKDDVENSGAPKESNDESVIQNGDHQEVTTTENNTNTATTVNNEETKNSRADLVTDNSYEVMDDNDENLQPN